MRETGFCQGDPRRRSPRHAAEHVTCDIGEVVNLSASGARIASRGKPPLKKGQTVQMLLTGQDGAIRVQGVVTWLRRTGWRKAEVGVRFINLTPAHVLVLATLAEFGFVRPRAAGQRTSEPAPARSASSSGQRPAATVRAGVALPNYYAILGIKPEATDEDIKAAFRDLARRYHPDHASGEEVTRKFIDAKQAYEILRDPERRALYDLGRAA